MKPLFHNLFHASTEEAVNEIIRDNPIFHDPNNCPPPGSRSVISRDLNQSINEYLHKPALPIYIVDRKERYPKDVALERVMFGLTNRLQFQRDKYVDRQLTLDIKGNKETGDFKVYATLFKVKNDDKTAKEFKSTIQNEFFKNNMSVAFSLNGQVHGYYTSEFITRACKWPLFKDYLLLHVDCTTLTLHYRNNLFMASRDRLKNGKEAETIRRLLADQLKKSELGEIYKQRKESFSADTGEAQDLLKTFSRNLPLNPEMLKLLKQTFKLDDISTTKKDNTRKKKQKNKSKAKPSEPFVSKRFPSIFTIDGKPSKDGKVLKGIPLGGNKTIKFSTDVENEYFDRIKDKGDLKLFVLDHGPNEAEGGDAPGAPKEIEDYFQVVKSSPQDGTIRVNLQPKNILNVGDELKMQADLTTVEKPDEPLQVVFYVKIEKLMEKDPKPKEPEVPQIGLPRMELVYKDGSDGVMTWKRMEDNGIPFDGEDIMATLTDDETGELETIFINMDSYLLKSYKSKFGSEEQLKLADNKYASQVYFHTLFLYSILKQKNYNISVTSDGHEEKTLEIEDVLKELFKSSYGEFLLKFGGTEELMSVIE